MKDVSSQKIVISWTAPPYNDQNGNIISYIIEHFSGKGNDSIVVPANETDYILAVLPHVRYRLRVAAVNSVGNGPFSRYLAVDSLQDGNNSTILFVHLRNT